MAPRKWDFGRAIEELQRGDLRRKQSLVALRVPPAKIQADLHWVVECYFDNKKNWGLAPTKVRAKYGPLLGDLDRARGKLAEIYQDPAVRAALVASDKDYRGKPYSWKRLMGTFDRLHDRVKAAEQAAANRVRGGRLKSPHREILFLDLCGRYEKYTGQPPSRNSSSGHGRDAGPFPRFVAAVFQEIEPEEAKKAKLTSAISHAITEWNSARGRKGTRYKGEFDW